MDSAIRKLIALIYPFLIYSQSLDTYLHDQTHADTFLFSTTANVYTQIDWWNQFSYASEETQVQLLKRIYSVGYASETFSAKYQKNTSVYLYEDLYRSFQIKKRPLFDERLHSVFHLNDRFFTHHLGISLSSLEKDTRLSNLFIQSSVVRKAYRFGAELSYASEELSFLAEQSIASAELRFPLKENTLKWFYHSDQLSANLLLIKRFGRLSYGKKESITKGKGIASSFSYQTSSYRFFVNYSINSTDIFGKDSNTEFLKLDRLSKETADVSARYKSLQTGVSYFSYQLDGQDSYFDLWPFNIFDFVSATRYRLKNLRVSQTTFYFKYTYSSDWFFAEANYQHILNSSDRYLLKERYIVSFPFTAYKGEMDSFGINYDAHFFIRLKATFKWKQISFITTFSQDIPIQYNVSSAGTSGNNTSTKITRSGGTNLKLVLAYYFE